MSLEFVNRICPNCKSPNYMVWIGDFSKAYKYKCINCNRYFNDIDFEKEPLQPVMNEERAMVLLRASKEMLEKILEDEFATVHYDDADCDVSCLIDDIDAFIEYNA